MWSARPQLTVGDYRLALGLAVAVGAGYLWQFNPGIVPEEDAAILMRYALNLGRGAGVVWNVGEPPVDGATDFLSMVLIGLLHRAGLGIEGAVRVLTLGAHAATVMLLFLGLRLLFGHPRPLALFPAAYLALGPGPHYVAVCFATPVFALAVTTAWLFAHRLLGDDFPRRAPLAFALSALVMGLVRPEGVFVAAFMLAAILIHRGGGRAREIVLAFAAVFLILGLAYFVWRWSYFGHPLPNPFYKKGGGVLYWGTLAKAVQNVARLGGPFLAALAVGVVLPRTRRYALFAAVPTVGFTLLWLLLSDETNYLMRFRYPILPVVLVSGTAVLGTLAQTLRPRVAVAAGTALAALSLLYAHRLFAHVHHFPTGLYDVATILREYAPRGYSLVTTEAGLLPLYSGWRSVDAWGLNDPWIAHHGGVTAEYLDRRPPDVVMFHAYDGRRGLGDAWERMVATLREYVESRGYEPAAVFGRDTRDTHSYYVRRGLRDSAALVARIRALPYPWYRDGRPSENFVSVPAGDR
jgi:hypothetical protein